MTPAEVLDSIKESGGLRQWVRDQIDQQDDADCFGKGERDWSLLWSDVYRIECELDVYVVEARHEMVPVIEKKIKVLNRRAAKLGCASIELTVGPDFEVEAEKRHAITGEMIKFKYLINEVSVHGNSPKLEGWSLVALVDHTESGNIFRRFPGMEDICLEQYRTVGQSCEHCNTKRRRKDTVILMSETGELKMVGKTCLKDFTGHTHPTQVLNLYSQLRTWLDELNAGGGVQEMREDPEIELEWFLKTTNAYIRVDGWVSRSTAYNSDKLTATADKVMKLALPPCNDRDRRDIKAEFERIVPNEQDTEVAEGAVKWAAMEMQPKSDYEHSISLIAKNGYTTYRQAGYAASIVNAYLRHCLQVAEEQRVLDTSKSQYQGAVKERITRTVEVLSIRTIETEFGALDTINMGDADGNVYVWFTGSAFMYENKAEECMSPVKVGMTVEAKMTVKGHDVFRGVPQTKVNRVSVLRHIEEESAA
jgi:hypothetical protein